MLYLSISNISTSYCFNKKNRLELHVFALRLHIKSKHTFQFRFKCGICSKGFVSLYNYRGHLASHDKVLERKCPKCPATFRYHSSLLEHSNSHHQGMKFMCDRDGCTGVFASTRALREHHRAVHESKRYTCPKCNKSFKWRSSIRFHEKNVHLNI